VGARSVVAYRSRPQPQPDADHLAVLSLCVRVVAGGSRETGATPGSHRSAGLGAGGGVLDRPAGGLGSDPNQPDLIFFAQVVELPTPADEDD
jgi:hypothetical protein